MTAKNNPPGASDASCPAAYQAADGKRNTIISITLPALDGLFHNAPFTFKPEIPLPVEAAPGQSERDVLAGLTLEMILSGMIKTLVSEPDCRHRGYYRRFVKACKPGLLEQLCHAAAVKADNGDFAFAAEIAGALKAVFPRSAKALHTRAAVFEAWALALESFDTPGALEKTRAQAALAYKEALSLKEPLTRTLYHAGCFHYRLQNYGQALEYLREYVLLSPDGKRKEAAMKKISRIESEHLDGILFFQARSCIEAGRDEEGLEKIRRFIEKNGDVWNAYFLLGLALRRLKRWEEAESAFRKARELGGSGPDTSNEIAICLIETGRAAHARKELESALAKDAENIKLLSNLAVVELKLGNREKAEAFFRTVLELSPEDPLARHFFGL